jgi:hypothetical protein
MRTLTLLAAALWLGAASGCDKQQEDAPGQAPKPTKISESMEYKLAIYNAKGLVAETDPTIAQFRTVLASLDPKYPEDAKAIGEQSLQAQRTLEAAGVRESLLTLMQNIDKSGGSYPDYASALKAYVAKRKPPGR